MEPKIENKKITFRQLPLQSIEKCYDQNESSGRYFFVSLTHRLKILLALKVAHQIENTENYILFSVKILKKVHNLKGERKLFLVIF